MDIIESLNWRSAIKNFDPSKKVAEKDLETLIEAANLAPTSGGFQPFKLLVISNQELKEQLVEHTFGQKQVAEASHVLVFAYQTKVDESLVDNYIDRAVKARGVTHESMQQFAQGMKGFIANIDEAGKSTWVAKQAYIALGVVMSAAAELKIDSCPMEGFNPMKYQELLGLEKEGLMPAVVLPIGYRSEEDKYSQMPKVRKSREELVLEFK